jgi:LL-diaminopimelate aminotransferase
VEKLASSDTYTGYGEYHGELPIRAALQNLYRTYGVELDPEEFFVSDGAKSDSSNLQSIFCTDSIVAVQDPAYPVYVDSNVIAGRTRMYNAEKGLYEGLIYMPCTEENGFFPDLPEQKVDIIYICSPNNPTGAVATKNQLKLFVDYALENQAIIFFDAAYSAFIQDPALPRSIYEIEGAKQCAIEMNSFSKIAGFTGVRLAWSVLPFALKAEDAKPGQINKTWMRRQSTFFNGPSNIVQEGGVAALSGPGRKECAELARFYLNNAKVIREGLTRMGMTVYGGDNAPYVWLKTPNKMPSWKFFDKLLAEAHVVGTPGSGFGPSGEGFIRLSAFGHAEDIRSAVQSIQDNLRI